ncbi:MAG: hypothetical protein U0165_16200 [Polyangiaceae bacterium]
MGRYIHGDEGFEYKYSFGEQPTNLCHLAAASGAGVQKLFFKIETPDDELICIPELVTVSRFGSGARVFERWSKKIRTALAREGLVGLRPFLESPDDLDLDVESLSFTATVVWQKNFEDREPLLRWVNSFLPSETQLAFEQLEREYGRDSSSMSDSLARVANELHERSLPYGLLPSLGFDLLGFCAARQIGEFGAEDDDALYSTVVWQDGEFHAPESVIQGDFLGSFDEVIARKTPISGERLTPEHRATRWYLATGQRKGSEGERLIAAAGVFCIAPPSETDLWAVARAELRKAVHRVPMPGTEQVRDLLVSLRDYGEHASAKRALALFESQGFAVEPALVDLVDAAG